MPQRDETFARKARLMKTLDGVGPGGLATILAYCPRSEHSQGRAACMAGLAPINDDSGKLKGPRHIEAGRAAVRTALYMAALVAIQLSCPSCASSPINLTATASPAKVVITAVMRKLIVTLSAILRSSEPWRHAQTA